MSKALFRYLRGELNGFYVTAFNTLWNKSTSYIKDFLSGFRNMQFNVDDMDAQTIYNIGTFAGVYLVRLSAGEAYGALRMTESHVVDGQERSERGLLMRETETFDFFHTEQDDYPDDINTLATEDQRSGMVGEEEVLGYIASSNLDVLDENGNVKSSAILSSPPSGEAYVEFYGNQFMFLSEQTNLVKNINVTIFLELYKVLQNIRYNGASIKSFVKMIEIICPNGLITIESIEKRQGSACFDVTLTYHSDVYADYQQQRLSVLSYVIALKFPQFYVTIENE